LRRRRRNASRDWPTLKDVIGRRFQLLDLHDDNLLAITIAPPRTKVNDAEIVLEFEDDSSGATKSLSFLGCGNLRVIMDFDVLADNSFAQTDVTACQTLAGQMRKFVRAQVPHWHVRYMPPARKNLPIRKKLSRIGNYRLFKVTFFGGTLEVLARGFAMKAATTKPRRPA